MPSDQLPFNDQRQQEPPSGDGIIGQHQEAREANVAGEQHVQTESSQQREEQHFQPGPTLINFTSTAGSTSHNLLNTPQINLTSIQQSGSPNFSFDSDSPGALAIAEDDDDIIDETPAQPARQASAEQPTGTAQSGAELEPTLPVGSVDSAASAEKDGFEVVRIKELALGETGGRAAVNPEQETTTAGGETGLTGAEQTRSSNASPGELQIVDEPTLVETSTEETTTKTVLTNTTGGETLQLPPSVVADPNSLLIQQQPSADIMQLLNERSVRELREKLELEQKRQQAAENSKMTVNALFSLNSATAATSTVGADIAAPAAQSSTLVESLQVPSALPATSSTLTSTPASNGTSKIGDGGQTPKRREAYRWASNLPIFAMAWSYKRYPNQRLRLACSSIRDGHELLKNTMSIVEFDEEHGELAERTQVFIGAPSCELKFIPTTDASQPDLIASATRELRIYSYHSEQQEVVLEAKLCPNKSYAYAGPLTSVDWNEVDARIVGGSSIDSTCTIWDIEAQESIATVPPPVLSGEQQRLKYKIQTQLIAHERPVHGMAFSRLGSGRDYFASCSADGSVRLFDLRNLKNSTILYEHPDKNKLNHISWNKMEPAQFVIVADSSNELVICDVRMPCRPLVKYSKHLKPVNSVDWAPHSPTHFCSGSSDHQALIWQLQGVSDEPLLAYRSEGEITRIRWSSTYNNWIGISFANCLEILRV